MEMDLKRQDVKNETCSLAQLTTDEVKSIITSQAFPTMRNYH